MFVTIVTIQFDCLTVGSNKQLHELLNGRVSNRDLVLRPKENDLQLLTKSKSERNAKAKRLRYNRLRFGRRSARSLIAEK